MRVLPSKHFQHYTWSEEVLTQAPILDFLPELLPVDENRMSEDGDDTRRDIPSPILEMDAGLNSLLEEHDELFPTIFGECFIIIFSFLQNVYNL